jgi:hypothetical protein
MVDFGAVGLMPWLIGAAMALAAGLFGQISGFDRSRAFYPTILMVIAGLYWLFAAIGGEAPSTYLAEAVPALLFMTLAVIGFRGSLWLVAVGLVGHGVMDLFHGALIANGGVPAFWPAFCSSYDVVAGAYLSARLRTIEGGAGPSLDTGQSAI